jgi:arabinose-5-phosphate isomerase
MIADRGRRVLRIEADAIVALIPKVDEQFDRAVEILRDCRGRVVLTGMGKSGSIAQKIASTMASTGTPAFFLHPAEGGHGDLGMLVRGDVVIAISNSGETGELIELLPAIKRLGLKLIALVGDVSSALARQSDVAIDVSVAEEACSIVDAPTASTTAALAMGDAIAVALLEERGFTEQDFAQLHPAGRLGRRLLWRVRDLMHIGEQLPVVSQGLLRGEAVAGSLERSSDDGSRGWRREADRDCHRRRPEASASEGMDLLQRRVKECMTPHPRRSTKRPCCHSVGGYGAPRDHRSLIVDAEGARRESSTFTTS